MEFTLRPFAADDLESLVLCANNYNIAKYMTNKFPHPYSVNDGQQFIDMAMKDIPVKIFAIAINSQASGASGLFPQADIQCKNAELGYWLAEPFWGHGICTKVVLQMVEYGFKTWDIDRIFARPFGENIASQKVLQKAGFTLEGSFKNTLFKNGTYQDELIYAIRR